MIKVFLSSTFKDLAPFREKAEHAINGLNDYKCIAMENFGARDASAAEYCPDLVAECDLFILLIGPTYGSCAPGARKSYTELEWDKAVELKKPRLVFAASEDFPITRKLLDTLPEGDGDRVRQLRQRVGGERIWNTFTTPDELAGKIVTAVRTREGEGQREDSSDTLAKYLAHLIERNTYLNPRGVRQTQRQVSLKLDQVYISLKAERELSGRMRLYRRTPAVSISQSSESVAGLIGGYQFDESIGPGGRPTHDLSSHEVRTEQVELSAAVREHSRIVVLGDPGSGKTTLLRFLALQFAQAYRDGKLTIGGKDGVDYGEKRLPIFFRVADYAEAIASNKNLRLTDFLATPFKDIASETAIAALFNDALKRGQAFVMLDGLDEVIDPGDRALIAGRIENFVSVLNTGNRVVVTTRIAGYREAPMRGDYQHFTLLDLERDQIKQFLHNWCFETERFLNKDASEEEIARNAQREIDSILDAVENNPGVKRLAVNPLLLTILALIHRNGSRLPNRRVELYDLATKTLLETWQIERMQASKYNIREGEAAQFLWPLAYWLHTEKPRGMATEQEIKYQLANFLAKTRKQESDHPEIISAADDFLRRVRHHTGLLVERAPNQYGFMHLTFEEYFAARELVRRPDKVAKKIYALRHQARWQEPILLAIGYLSEAFPNMPGDIIRSAILAEGDTAEEEGFKPSLFEDVLHRDLLFAAQCIGDCSSLEPTLRRQVVEKLVRLYLDSQGAGKYEPLRERIAKILNYLKHSEAAHEAAETALAALRDENDYVRSSSASALGEVKVGTPDVVSALLAALRDGKEDVRHSAAGALSKLERTPDVVSMLLAALRDEKESVRRAAEEALGEAKAGTPNLVNGLLAALRDNSDYVRRSAARALGELKVGTPEVVSGLLAALRDENDQVRRSAARALGEVKVGLPEVVSGLLTALRDENDQVRRSAAGALGEMKGIPEVVSGLLAALRDANDHVRRSAAGALGKFEATADVVSGLLTALRDENHYVLSSVADALGETKVGTPEVVSGLLAALRDENYHVRSSAARALGEVKAGTLDVVSGLFAALRDENDHVRSSAAVALGKLKATPDVVSSLLAALHDENDYVQSSAASALDKLEATPDVVSSLLAALRDENDYVRRSATSALGKLEGTPDVMSGLLAALRDENDYVRRSAARALAEVKVGTPNVLSGLLTALRDENDYVRRSAARALGEVKVGSPEVVTGLLAALRDEDETMRRSAAGALGEVKVGSPDVVRGLLAALRDENDYVRNSAAGALGEVKVVTADVVSGLLIALRDENDYVRRSSAAALGEISRDRKAKLPRELCIQVAITLRGMLDELRNQRSEFLFLVIGGRLYSKSVDVIWEALWLLCQRMDEQHE